MPRILLFKRRHPCTGHPPRWLDSLLRLEGSSSWSLGTINLQNSCETKVRISFTIKACHSQPLWWCQCLPHKYSKHYVYPYFIVKELIYISPDNLFLRWLFSGLTTSQRVANQYRSPLQRQELPFDATRLYQVGIFTDDPQGNLHLAG